MCGVIWYYEENWALVKWERKGPRHQCAQRTGSGLPGNRLGWPCQYGNSVSVLVLWGMKSTDYRPNLITDHIEMEQDSVGPSWAQILSVTWSLFLVCRK